MSWVRLDDSFHTHPKVLAAGNAGAGLFVRCLTYCSSHLTDGFVPSAAAKLLGSTSDIKRCVAAGLLERVEGGWRIPDYLDFNPSADQVRQRIAKERERKSEWRAKKASQRDATRMSQRDSTITATSTSALHIPSHPLSTSSPTDESTRARHPSGENLVDIEAWAKRRRA